ncbi:MAG: hypothetical protein GY941_22470 [Planctomycetes bacterium]|nr:hypothetical protein [Planctomycetota bacterium]
METRLQEATKLLQATYDIMDEVDYYNDFFYTTAFWDGEVCDGFCLQEEIGMFLEEDSDE